MLHGGRIEILIIIEALAIIFRDRVTARSNMAKKLIGAAILIAVSSMPSMAQDAQKGRIVFNVCLVCPHPSSV